MLILGLESSCDDTSVAFLEITDNGEITILAEKTTSQIAVHAAYGGVVPEIAGRCHAEAIVPLIETVLAGKKPEVIAVTAGPGLVTGLVVGVTAAKTLSYLWNIPLVAVNHIAGHAASVLLAKENLLTSSFEFPAICLIVSGGHTELLLMKSPTEFALIGKTRDDAAGECFDKVAKLLGLDYPGGPKISALAKTGNPTAINFPRPMLDQDNFDFSFAGLKTAALYYLRDNKLENINDFCASFEQAIVDVLVEKTLRAVKKYNPKQVILAGGVAANPRLRHGFDEQAKINSLKVLVPNLSYTSDNGAMIAVASYFLARAKKFTRWQDIKVDPNWTVY